MKREKIICWRFSALTFALASFFLCSLLFAQDQIAEHQAGASRGATVLDSMPRARRIGLVALSPDGSQVAYVVKGELSVIPVSGGPPRIIAVEDKLALRDVAWSPDSKRIAFIADLPGDIPAAQVWIAGVGGGSATKHADLKGYAESPRFSPDGSKLALLFIEGIPRIAGPLQPMTPLAGVIDEKVYEQRIALLDLQTDRLTQVTPVDMYVYEYDWTPDGRGWAATAAHGAGDANWYIARLYRASADSGEMHEIYKPKLQIAEPRVSLDGKNIAFIEGLMSDEGSTGGDIYVVPSNGGAARNVTPNIKSSPSALAWTGPSRITFAQNLDGNSSFGSVNLDGGAPKTLWKGEEAAFPSGDTWISNGSSNGDPLTTAIVRQSANTPPEVWAGPIGNWKQLTSLNAEIKPAWGEMRDVHWNNGSMRVQGWLMLPKDFDPGKTYPLVVTVHGGPSAACASRWDERGMGALSALGYFSLCPNPRGSYGQGEAFTRGNVKDFGGGDYRDIMAGVDALTKQYPIDKKRLGIRGHSYGGYMTMWAETQPADSQLRLPAPGFPTG
jgi:dipeptidyl aminopeptidase/acylaminoacyl peptidase